MAPGTSFTLAADDEGSGVAAIRWCISEKSEVTEAEYLVYGTGMSILLPEGDWYIHCTVTDRVGYSTVLRSPLLHVGTPEEEIPPSTGDTDTGDDIPNPPTGDPLLLWGILAAASAAVLAGTRK